MSKETVVGTEARVCQRIAERQALGIKKYGTTVAENPLTLRQWLNHALEESLDQAIYLQRAIEELDRGIKLKRPIFIIGPAQHGKSTARQFISEHLGVKGGSCSDIIYKVWSELTDTPEQKLRNIPKEQCRSLLVALGDWLTGSRPCFPWQLFVQDETCEVDYFRIKEAVTRKALKYKPSATYLIDRSLELGVQVLDGIRRMDELDGATCDPIVLWIENPYWDRPRGDNFSISHEYADSTILNTGSKDHLQGMCVHFCETFVTKKL